MLFLENGPEISDSEQAEEDHGDELEDLDASGCDLLDQARITAANLGVATSGTLFVVKPGNEGWLVSFRG
jgi:hypothetical protein